MVFGCCPVCFPYREFDLPALSSLLLARAIYGKHMLLYLVIVIHKWQNWTWFYWYAKTQYENSLFKKRKTVEEIWDFFFIFSNYLLGGNKRLNIWAWNMNGLAPFSPSNFISGLQLSPWVILDILMLLDKAKFIGKAWKYWQILNHMCNIFLPWNV